MPNKKAAIKDLKQTKKRTLRNSLIKRNIKEIIKKGKKAVIGGQKVDEISKELQKVVDKAVKNNILKPNAGNRKKSRFADMVKRVAPVSEAKVEDKK
ncbi:MAG: 30S ribosomal protein S20 [Candidatus Komeilibacteria bacterium]|jgi:small subunit ribosomal protein S20|nr:30S ribosomal protein S20 [Candidatus Komeilibacteria bacterium]